MLASGAHIKIGTREYIIDESVVDHYRHRFRPIQVGKVAIEGLSGKEQIDPDKLIHGYTGWEGGEGRNIFDPAAPTTYRQANGMNVRRRGQATVRPLRTRATLTSEETKRQPYFAVGDGALWALQNTRGHFSTDYGGTWTTLTEANTGVTGFDAAAFITSAIGDERFVYYAAHEAAGVARRIIIAHDAVAGASTTAVTAADANFPFAELAIFNGRLYAWTGRKLYEVDISDTFPISPTGDSFRKVFDTGVDPSTTHVQGNQWTAGMVEAETSLIFFYARRLSGGNVYEFKNGVAKPFWRAPLGFTIGSIAYANGVVWIAGHWGVGLVSTGTDSTALGYGQLYSIPMDTRRLIDLGTIREFDGDASGGLLMTKMSPSYGGQVLMAGAGTGRIFIYDAAADGLSMFDHLKSAPVGGDGTVFTNNPNQRIGDLITAGPNRLVSIFSPATAGAGTFQVLTYKDDSPGNRETDGQMATDSTTINFLEQSEHDTGFPLSPKTLHGIHVTYLVEDAATTSGLLLNQRIIIKYSVDGGAFVTAGTISSTTTPVGPRGKVFLAVSGVRYYRLRIRFEVDNNSTDGVKPPVVYAVLDESSLVDWIEEWEFVVRAKDEPPANARPSDRRLPGPLLHEYLEDLFQARADITLLDGYRLHKAPAEFTTHTVKLVSLDVNNQKIGEGAARIVLRAVPATS